MNVQIFVLLELRGLGLCLGHLASSYNQQQQIEHITKMQVIKSIKIDLSPDELIRESEELSKEQLVHKLKIWLQAKKIQIMEKTDKLNGEHLLVLQKKVLFIEKKDDQITKLNNILTAYKNEIDEQKDRESDLLDEAFQMQAKIRDNELKINDFNTVLQEQKEKRETIKKQHEKSEAIIKNLHENLSQQKTKHKIQVQHLQQEKQHIINNASIQKHKIESQHQQMLTNINNRHEDQLSLMKQELRITKIRCMEENKIINDMKKSNIKLMKNVQSLQQDIDKLKEELVKLAPKGCVNQQMQTELEAVDIQNQNVSELVQNAEFGINVCIECEKCQQLTQRIQMMDHNTNEKQSVPKNLASSTKRQTFRFNEYSQTNIIQLKQSATQTQTKYLETEQELLLIENVKTVLEIRTKQLSIITNKYADLEYIYENRPSRKSDLSKIFELQQNVIELQLELLKSQNYTDSLQVLAQGLKQQIQDRNKCNLDQQCTIIGTNPFSKEQEGVCADAMGYIFRNSKALNYCKPRSMTLPVSGQRSRKKFLSAQNWNRNSNTDNHLQKDTLGSILFEKGIYLQKKQTNNISKITSRKLYTKYKSDKKVRNSYI